MTQCQLTMWALPFLVVVDGAAADDPTPPDDMDVALVIEEHELHNVPNAFAILIGLVVRTWITQKV